MNIIVAKILLENLLNRVELQDDGSKQLTGVLTDAELEALQFAVAQLTSERREDTEASSESTQPTSASVLQQDRELELNLNTLSLPEPPNDVRLCLDFGTAMSKATLVHENDDTDIEEIHVLRLGVPGDQEEISEVMLISSVFIDGDGFLWFGKSAVNRSMIEGGDGTRQRLDNIKRSLSEEGHDDIVSKRFNPTNVEVTYGDMVLAYLMFLTWAVNRCLDDLGYPLNLPRRYAMPCLTGEKRRETSHRLKQLVGEAQILADTFGADLANGIPVVDFMAAVGNLRHCQRIFPFVAEGITEPLGVASSIVSWTNQVDSLILVIDVGAGTSDLSLYRLRIDPKEDINVAMEVEDSSRVLTEAGNHLDKILIELIIKKGGITSDNPRWENIRGALELEIRDHKETLFNEGSVFITLMNSTEVEIELNEFLEHNAVKSFGNNLKEIMVQILESIDESWVGWITANPKRKLAVALTGGGSELPMVRALAEGSISVNGKDIPVFRSKQFPDWLRELDENLEYDYPRVAVSLGGARKQMIKDGGTANITGGDVTSSAVLGGFYTKGN
ncbi:MAG: hypothetical protein F4Y34_01555 [Gammaproteobacteria bacterium]|nr:hypothetical protein [Gammaproteobacteria bacterium]MYH85860.1 hypothetical protein [Gammaproteobacteria bacterium]